MTARPTPPAGSPAAARTETTPAAGSRTAVGAAVRRAVALAALAVAALPAAAVAAPPANDAPGAATDVAAVTAENGAVTERQGVAELLEATPDAGVAPCLGPRTFARTAWFRVPATATPTRVRLEAFSVSGAADATPDLAAYVQPPTGTNTALPQACDGTAAGPRTADSGAAAVLDVPEDRALLVQVGAPDDSPLTQVVLSVATDALPLAGAPAGDAATGARRFPLGRTRLVPLGAARLTEEDPAAPACPAPGSIWRQLRIERTGLQVAAARGAGVGALAVFLGRRPTTGNGAACAPGTGGLVEVPFRARRGQRAWVRVGTTGPEAPTARLAISGPCQQTPLRPVRRTRVAVKPGKRTARAVRLRLTLRGPCVSGARVVVRQAGRVVARGTVRRLVRGTRTVAVRRVPGVRTRRGSARVAVRALKLRTRASVRLP